MDISKQITKQNYFAKSLGFNSWSELSEHTRKSSPSNIEWIKCMAKYEEICKQCEI